MGKTSGMNDTTGTNALFCVPSITQEAPKQHPINTQATPKQLPNSTQTTPNQHPNNTQATPINS
eukprot:4169400-Lingulodinium_polyedra.AAC.1